jgi:hypothetical protein
VNRKTISRPRVVWLLVPVILALSCGITPLSTREVDLDCYVPIERIPLSVGLCIDEGIKNLNKDSPQSDLMYVRGKTLTALIEQASAKTFKKQTLVSAKETPQELSAMNIDAVVSVKLIAVVGGGLVRIGHVGDVYVTMRWDITSLDGKPVYFCEVVGQGKKMTHLGYSVEERRQVFIDALRDHFQKAHKEIVSSVWWKDRSWRRKMKS